jgi:predicted enzyme related to lactoylglutathione lyase
MSIATLQSIVINGTDLEPLIAFWKTVLGVEEVHRFPGFVWLGSQSEGGVKLAFQQVPEGKATERNRLHLDMKVDDLATAIAAIEAAGGAKVEEHEIEGFVWYVCQDPGGNEFCIGA